MGDSAKILIVDDNPDFLFTMETFLKRNGFQTLIAEDGGRALDIVENERPDLILLDVMMERIYSGLDVCKHIRNNPELRNIPIIGISGMGEEIGVHLDKWGDDEYFPVDEYFEKPVNREKLLESIKVRLKKGVLKREYPKP